MINLVGDPVDMLVNPESLPDEIDRVRKDFGLDQPVHIQYWKFLTGALSGDLGNSFILPSAKYAPPNTPSSSIFFGDNCGLNIL